ncbi:MAG: hypothetical protein KGK13_06790 [Rhodospirillales bacterium]|nr:hypothetical protein [Rhodospirillales bacterium]
MPSFSPSRDSIEVQLATSRDLADLAYEIRYEAYRASGYIGERADGLFSDEEDTRANAQTAVVFRDGIPSGTVRALLLDPGSDNPDFHHIPALEMFGPEIRELLAVRGTTARPATAIEATKLALASHAERDITVLQALFRTVRYLVHAHDADVVFNAVKHHHMPFYRRLGYRKIEDPRPYPGLAVQTGLMACFREEFADTVDRVPFMSGLAVTDPTCQALLAGHRVQIFSTGRPEERPALEAPNRRGRAEPAPDPDADQEPAPG